MPRYKDEFWLIDNGGYVDGPHETVDDAWSAAKGCKEDKEFTSRGNLCIVQIVEQLDNYYHGAE